MAMIAMIALGAWSCSDDILNSELPEDENSSVPGYDGSPANYYLTFQFLINNPSTGTRADTYDDENADSAGDGDYVYGDVDENGIGETGHTVFFFKGGVLSIVQPITFSYTEDMTPGEGDGDKIEKRYWTLIRNITREQLPDRALVLLNGQTKYDDIVRKSTIGKTNVQDLLDYIWEEESFNLQSFGRNDDGLFVMTNSAYLKEKEGQLVVNIEEEVTEKMFHELKDENEKVPPQIDLPEDQILTIHVERMLAKVTFRIDAESGADTDEDGFIRFPAQEAIICAGIDDDGNTNNVYGKWRATVLGWNMNAFETKSRLFKKIRIENSTPYSQWTAWHDPAYYRSFWAIDENYDTGYYPDQYREAVNYELDSFSKDKNNNGQTPSLKYLSFTELRRNDGINHTQYIPENTYDYTKLNKGEQVDMIAGTHLIISSRLDIKIDNENDWVKGGQNQDFYRDEFGIFYKDWKACFWAVVRRFNNTLSSQTKMRYHLYNWGGDEKLQATETYEALTTSAPDREGISRDFKLCYNGEEITWAMVKAWGDDMKEKVLTPAKIKNGDGRLLPWIDGMDILDLKHNKQKLKIYKSILQNQIIKDGKTVDIDPSNDLYGHLDEQNEERLLRECTANDIKSLLLEWLGPIDHFSTGAMYYAAPVKIDVNKNVMGTVRNAWYRYTLQEIKKPGISVDDLYQPIIPDAQSTHDQTNLIFDVIDWHEFDFTAPLL